MLARAAVIATLCLVSVASAATASQRVDTAALLARYEPVVEQYRSDWRPATIDAFLANADLERLSGSSWSVVLRSPPATALANRGPNQRLDTRGCSPAVNLDSCYKRRPTAASVYGRVWQMPGVVSPVTVLEYWFFYPLDDWHTPPVAPILWHMHEGDWEQVSVELGPAGVPVAIAASQHDEGVTRPWSKVQLAAGTHPVVYVALGSHANYLSPGYHGVPGVPHVIPPQILRRAVAGAGLHVDAGEARPARNRFNATRRRRHLGRHALAELRRPLGRRLLPPRRRAHEEGNGVHPSENREIAHRACISRRLAGSAGSVRQLARR